MRSLRFVARLGLLSPLLLVTTGCPSSSSSGSAAADVTAPSFQTTPVLSPSPNPDAPLGCRIAFTTDEPSLVHLTIDDGIAPWTVTPEPGSFDTSHDVPALGLRPQTTHLFTIEVEDAAGNRATSPTTLSYLTPGLPSPFPPLATVASDPSRMEPGYTLFNVLIASANVPQANYGLLVIVDEAGDVRWFLRYDESIGDARRLAHGHLLFETSRDKLIEIDMFGEVQDEFWATNLSSDVPPPGAKLLAVDTFHHEAIEMPAGSGADFAALSSELRTFPNYPTSILNPTVNTATTDVIGDTVVEFLRDGTVLAEHRLFDVLDPYRVSYDSLGGFWTPTYGLPVADWAHANAVVHDPSDDSFLVSLRHQDAIVKIARPTGDLVWILGDPARWGPAWQPYLLTPVAVPTDPKGFEWSYHQHAPELTSTGSIVLFDNGNGRAIPPTAVLPFAERYSRAVEYVVDPVAMTVDQTWSYGSDPTSPSFDPTEHFYAQFLCDADPLPQTGNVLVCDGADSDDGTIGFTRIFEVTRDTPADIVFEIRIEDPLLVDGWLSYRAERIDDLYR